MARSVSDQKILFIDASGPTPTTVEDPRGGPVGVQPVGLGVDHGPGHVVGHGGPARGGSAVGSPAVELDQAGGGFGVAGRAAQRQTPLGAGRGHGHLPALAHATEHLGRRDLHVLEEDLGEPGLAVELGDGPDGHARDCPWARGSR